MKIKENTLDETGFHGSIRRSVAVICTMVSIMVTMLALPENVRGIYGIWVFVGMIRFERPFTLHNYLLFFPFTFWAYIYFKLFSKKYVRKTKREIRQEKIDKIVRKKWYKWT